jgi:hypothetical protein
MTRDSYLQKRRTRLEEEIRLLEKVLEKRDLFFILKASVLSAIVIFIANFLFDLTIGHKSLLQFFNENGWRKFGFTWFFWFCIEYIFMILLPKRKLKKKNIEFIELEGRVETDLA